MGRRGRWREEEIETEGESVTCMPVILLSSDDDAANEDLTLAIVSKSRLQQTKRRRDTDQENDRSLLIDLSTSSAEEIEALPNRKVAEGKQKLKKRSKKKKNKEDVAVAVIEQPETPAVEDKLAGASDSLTELGNEGSNNLVLKKLLRFPRYFDPGHGSWEACFNCGEEGHTAANCKEEKRKKPCFVCGMFGHNPKYCIQGQDCFICKRRGHHAKECPDKRKNNSEGSVLCLRCGELGHDMSSCRNNYAFSDLKEIQCYICKNYGHLCCVDYKDNGPSEISCYNCAETGHSGQGCAKQRLEHNATTAPSPTMCFKCGQEGHFARGCMKSAKTPKESSSPSRRLKVKKDPKNSKSLPRDFGRDRKNKSPHFDGRMRAVKSTVKGGWIVDDSSYLPEKKPKTKDWVSSSPRTPGGWNNNRYHTSFSQRGYTEYPNYSSPQTPHYQRHNYYGETPNSRSSTGGYYHNSFTASRFGHSRAFYG